MLFYCSVVVRITVIQRNSRNPNRFLNGHSNNGQSELLQPFIHKQLNAEKPPAMCSA